MLALAALLVGASGTAFAWTNCGENIQYEVVGTELRLMSPDPTKPAQIQSMVFKNNTTITSVTIPDNVTLIGGQAFMGCTALRDVDLGRVQDISSCAFDSCSALTDIVIPPTVTNIGYHAFYGCSSLVSVLCRPYTAPTLGTDGFTGCHTDLKICVPARGEYYGKTNWTSYYADKVILCFLDENDEQSTTSSKITQFRDTDHRTFIDIFRTLRKAGCFNTLTLPFNVPDIGASPLVGAEVYEFAGATVQNGTLQLDITPVTSNSLTAGTPYLIQWDNTGEVLNHMHFTDITWDNDQTADNAGTGNVHLHGFYGKTHINDSTEAGVNTGTGNNHLNLFLQGGNQLYWPSDGNDADAKMLGFRAWFRINGNTVAGAPVRRGMPASLNIVPAPATPTAVEETATTDSAVSVTKELQNGHLIIIRNGVRYSINGQRL